MIYLHKGPPFVLPLVVINALHKPCLDAKPAFSLGSGRTLAVLDKVHPLFHHCHRAGLVQFVFLTPDPVSHLVWLGCLSVPVVASAST